MVRLDRDVPYPAGQVRSVALLFDGRRLQADATAEVAPEGAAVLVQDMLGRQGRDDVELLGVEEDQEPGDPVGGRVGVVVEKPVCVCPAAILVKRPGGSGPA